jgi:hypothetical protein
MQPRRQSSFEPDEERGPPPLPDGRLDPPRRNPPTAVGTATPKPPPHPYRPTRYGRGVTRLERTARGFLGSLLVAAGGVTVTLAPVVTAAVAGAVITVTGALVAYRAFRAPSLFHTPSAARRAARRRRHQLDTDTTNRGQPNER